jgi:hypothetical protein
MRLIPNTLSLIENGRTSPSVHTLQLLADGLGISLAAFFEEVKPAKTLVNHRQGQRNQMRFSMGYWKNWAKGCRAGRRAHPGDARPGHAEAKDISHVGREFIYCLEGKVICIIANQQYTLTPGDSLLFDAAARIVG